MKRIIAYIQLIILSIKGMFRINIGDNVYYNGQVCRVSNLMPRISITKGSIYHRGIKKNELKKVISVKNMTGSYKFMWRFYKQNWFEIWVKNWSISETIKFTLKNNKWFDYGKNKTER